MRQKAAFYKFSYAVPNYRYNYMVIHREKRETKAKRWYSGRSGCRSLKESRFSLTGITQVDKSARKAAQSPAHLGRWIGIKLGD